MSTQCVDERMINVRYIIIFHLYIIIFSAKMSWPVFLQSIAEASLSGRWIIKVSSTSENIKSPRKKLDPPDDLLLPSPPEPTPRA